MGLHKNRGKDCQSTHLGDLALNQSKKVSFLFFFRTSHFLHYDPVPRKLLSHWIIFICEARLSYAAVMKMPNMPSL